MNPFGTPEIFSSELSPASKQHLIETTKWTKFLAILSFISIGFMALMMLFVIGASSMIAKNMPGGLLNLTGFIFYFIFMMLLYIYPAYCLIKFSACMKNGLLINSSQQIEEGFRHHKNLYKFIGILSIIFLGLTVLFLLFALIAGMAFNI
jgi:hypothetical protein